MPKPDKATLMAYVDELGFSDAFKANLLQELEADENRAAKFIEQRLRHTDYTRKTQELASQRKELDVAVTQQVQEYASKLQEADGKIAKILKDFEHEQISRTTAENRLRTLAVKYEIPKEDLADLLKDSTPAPNARPNGDAITLEQVTVLMNKTLEDYTKKLMPELVSFPQISNLQQEIRDQHKELFGKRITNEEMKEIMTAAAKDGSPGLMKIWEDRFEVGKVRGEIHDKEVAANAIKHHEEERTRKASEDAIRQVHNQADPTKPLSSSPVLREYRSRSEDGQPEAPANGKGKENDNVKPPEPRRSGAERAAIKWTERANQGLIGKAPAA
jgi:hypothetical protein